MNHTAAPRHALGNTCCWPRKKEPVAIKNEKHMRQRWRLIRCVPETPRTSIRRSPAAASKATEPRKKIIPTGTPGFGATPPVTSLPTWTMMRTPIASAKRNAPQSKILVSRSEEHTSELQSQSNLVCRLLLEKKKKKKNIKTK